MVVAEWQQSNLGDGVYGLAKDLSNLFSTGNGNKK